MSWQLKMQEKPNFFFKKVLDFEELTGLDEDLKLKQDIVSKSLYCDN